MNVDRRTLVARDCEEALAGMSRALEPLKNDRILITGGTGFIGTWLAEMLAFLNDNHGFSVRMLLSSKKAQAFREKAPHLAERKDVELLEMDVRRTVELPEDVNRIIHAACSPDSRLHASDPITVIDVVVNGTATLLAAAARLPELKMVLNVSSGWVYGSQPVEHGGISESSWGSLDPHAIASVYPEAKRCGETVCAAYANGYRLPIVNARPFAYVGPYQLLDKPWAVNNFFRDAMLGGPIRILGNPETVRSYLYASDMACWLLKILTNGKSGQSYNVGSPQGVTLRELAKIIAEHCPNTVEIQSQQLGKKIQPSSTFVPDTSLAESELHLRDTVDLRDAIGRTIAWNRSARGAGAIAT